MLKQNVLISLLACSFLFSNCKKEEINPKSQIKQELFQKGIAAKHVAVCILEEDSIRVSYYVATFDTLKADSVKFNIAICIQDDSLGNLLRYYLTQKELKKYSERFTGEYYNVDVSPEFNNIHFWSQEFVVKLPKKNFIKKTGQRIWGAEVIGSYKWKGLWSPIAIQTWMEGRGVEIFWI